MIFSFIPPLYLSFQPLMLTTVNKGISEHLVMFFLSTVCFSWKERPQNLPNICYNIFTPPQMFSASSIVSELMDWFRMVWMTLLVAQKGPDQYVQIDY